MKITQANESQFTFCSPAKVIYNCLTSSPWWVGGWGGSLSGGFWVAGLSCGDWGTGASQVDLCQPEWGDRRASAQHGGCSASSSRVLPLIPQCTASWKWDTQCSLTQQAVTTGQSSDLSCPAVYPEVSAPDPPQRDIL